MPKYRSKTVVEAKQFVPGMEDGYSCYSLSGAFLGYYSKDGALPRVKRVPAVMGTNGYSEVYDGDWVVEDGGRKTVFRPKIFEDAYEEVDDKASVAHVREWKETLVQGWNDDEWRVAARAVAAYREALKEDKEEEEFLSHQKFHLGQIVAKRYLSRLDRMFGIGDEVGKVVGYDRQNDYYRIFFSQENPYVGVREEELQQWDGEAPEEVKAYPPNVMARRTLRVRLDGADPWKEDGE